MSHISCHIVQQNDNLPNNIIKWHIRKRPTKKKIDCAIQWHTDQSSVILISTTYSVASIRLYSILNHTFHILTFLTDMNIVFCESKRKRKTGGLIDINNTNKMNISALEEKKICICISYMKNNILTNASSNWVPTTLWFKAIFIILHRKVESFPNVY